MADMQAMLAEKHFGLPTWAYLGAGGALILFVWWRNRQAAASSASTAGSQQQVPGEPLNFLVQPPSASGGGSDGGTVSAPPPLPPLTPPVGPTPADMVQTIWGPVPAGSQLNAIGNYLLPQSQYIQPGTLQPISAQDIANFQAANPAYGATGSQPSGMGQ